ncbi:F-box/kelch-repeat protein At3g06240-like [Rutidosis leptorrhynchoides]|uniref:F-box/kelch-repeat protein At3g06240-like n=1 Tax=Rutidosis leptorrhynchoides TaxID=125765 RepID=UPI003A99DC45
MILPNQIQSTEGNIVNSYGFGVGSLTEEYKVIRVFQDIGLSKRVLHAEIYTIGTRKWRNLSLGHLTYSLDGLNGTFLNNHVHWNIRHYEDTSENICSFNIDNETFQLFPSPPVSLDENTYTNRILGVVKGCLCYSYYTRTTCEITIWVMKEYGIENSWQKEVLINQNISPIVRGSNDILCSPMGSLKDGSILMMYGEGKLLVYRPDTRTFEETQFSYVDAINDDDDAGVILNPIGKMEDIVESFCGHHLKL